MAGWIFLFAAWGGWIVTTFIMKKSNPLRLQGAALALLLIIVYPFSLTIYSVTVSCSALILVFSAFLQISKAPFLKRVYLFLSVMILMFYYAGFFLLELFDPVWVLVDRKLLLTSGLFILSWLLYSSSPARRYAAVIIGSFQGEIFLSIFLSKWKMPYMAGAADYLDIMAITSFLLFCSHVLSGLAFRMKTNLEPWLEKSSLSVKTGQKAKF